MARPEDWSALGLSSDPTPGDPSALDDLISSQAKLVTLATTIDEGLTEVKNTADGAFVGKTADALRKIIDNDLRNYVSSFKQAQEDVQGALKTYVEVMRTEQGRADEALSAAAGLGEDDDTEREGYKSTAEDAKSNLESAASTAASTIRAAGNSIDSPVNECDEFWKALGWLAIILIIPAIIVGGPLALFVLALNVALLIKTAVDFANGKASVTELVLSILGVIAPTTRGLSVGKLWGGLKGAFSGGVQGGKAFFGITKGFEFGALWVKGVNGLWGGFRFSPGFLKAGNLGIKFGTNLNHLRFGPAMAGLSVINNVGVRTFQITKIFASGFMVVKNLPVNIYRGLTGAQGLRLVLPVAANEIRMVGLGQALKIGFIDRGLFGMHRYGLDFATLAGGGSKISGAASAGVNIFSPPPGVGELVRFNNAGFGTMPPIAVGTGPLTPGGLGTGFGGGVQVVSPPPINLHLANQNMGGVGFSMPPLPNMGALIADVPFSGVAPIGAPTLGPMIPVVSPPTSGIGAVPVTNIGTTMPAVNTPAPGTVAVPSIGTSMPAVTTPSAGGVTVPGIGANMPAVTTPGAGGVTVPGIGANMPAVTTPGVGGVTVPGIGANMPSVTTPGINGVTTPGVGAVTVPGIGNSMPSVTTPGVGGVNIPGIGVNMPGVNTPGVGGVTIPGIGTNMPSVTTPGVGGVNIPGIGTNMPGVNAPGIGAISPAISSPGLGGFNNVSVPGVGAVDAPAINALNNINIGNISQAITPPTLNNVGGKFGSLQLNMPNIDARIVDLPSINAQVNASPGTVGTPVGGQVSVPELGINLNAGNGLGSINTPELNAINAILPPTGATVTPPSVGTVGATMPGVTTPGINGVVTPGVGGVTTPGVGNVSTPGMGGVTTPGVSGVSTPGVGAVGAVDTPAVNALNNINTGGIGQAISPPTLTNVGAKFDSLQLNTPNINTRLADLPSLSGQVNAVPSTGGTPAVGHVSVPELGINLGAGNGTGRIDTPEITANTQVTPAAGAALTPPAAHVAPPAGQVAPPTVATPSTGAVTPAVTPGNAPVSLGGLPHNATPTTGNLGVPEVNNARPGGTPASSEIGRVDLSQPAPPVKQPGLDGLHLQTGGAHLSPLSPMDLQVLRTLGLFGPGAVPPRPMVTQVFMQPSTTEYAAVHTYQAIDGLPGVSVRVDEPNASGSFQVSVAGNTEGIDGLRAFEAHDGSRSVIRIEQALDGGSFRRWDFDMITHEATGAPTVINPPSGSGLTPGSTTGGLGGSSGVELGALTPTPTTSGLGGGSLTPTPPASRTIDLPGLGGRQVELRFGADGSINGVVPTGGPAGGLRVTTSPDLRVFDVDIRVSARQNDNYSFNLAPDGTTTFRGHQQDITLANGDFDNLTVSVHRAEDGTVLNVDSPRPNAITRLNDGGFQINPAGGGRGTAFYDANHAFSHQDLALAAGALAGIQSLRTAADGSLSLVRPNGTTAAADLTALPGGATRVQFGGRDIVVGPGGDHTHNVITLRGGDGTTIGVVHRPTGPGHAAPGAHPLTPGGTAIDDITLVRHGDTEFVLRTDDGLTFHGGNGNQTFTAPALHGTPLDGNFLRMDGHPQLFNNNGDLISTPTPQPGGAVRIQYGGHDLILGPGGVHTHNVTTLTGANGATLAHLHLPVDGTRLTPGSHPVNAGGNAVNNLTVVRHGDNGFVLRGNNELTFHGANGHHNLSAPSLTGTPLTDTFLHTGAHPQLFNGSGDLIPVTPQPGGALRVQHGGHDLILGPGGAHTHNVTTLTGPGGGTPVGHVHLPVDGTRLTPGSHPLTATGTPINNLTVVRHGNDGFVLRGTNELTFHGTGGNHTLTAPGLTGTPLDGNFLRGGANPALLNGEGTVIAPVHPQTGGAVRVQHGNHHLVLGPDGAHTHNVTTLTGAGNTTVGYVHRPVGADGGPLGAHALDARGNPTTIDLAAHNGGFRTTSDTRITVHKADGSFDFQTVRLGDTTQSVRTFSVTHNGQTLTALDVLNNNTLAKVDDVRITPVGGPGGGFRFQSADGNTITLHNGNGQVTRTAQSTDITVGGQNLTRFRVTDADGTTFDAVRLSDDVNGSFIRVDTHQLLDGNLNAVTTPHATVTPDGNGFRVQRGGDQGLSAGEYKVYDGSGKLTSERINVIRDGQLVPDQHLKVTFTDGATKGTWSRIRTDNHGTVIAPPPNRTTGLYDGGPVDMKGHGNGVVRLTHHGGAEVFMRRPLHNGNTLDVHTSASGGEFGLFSQRPRWSEINPAGNAVQHGSRHWGESTRSWFDVADTGKISALSHRVRHFRLNPDGGHVLTDMNAVPVGQALTKGQWHRYDADFKHLAEGTRDWGHGRGWSDVAINPRTGNTVTVHEKFGRFQPTPHDVRRYQQLTLGEDGAFKEGSWLSHSPAAKETGISKELKNGNWLESQRLAEQRPPVWFRNVLSPNIYFHTSLDNFSYLRSDSAFQIAVWKESPTPAGRPGDTGISATSGNGTIQSINRAGDMVREVRKLGSGNELTVGDVKMPDGTVMPGRNLPWSEGADKLQGVRTFDQADFTVTNTRPGPAPAPAPGAAPGAPTPQPPVRPDLAARPDTDANTMLFQDRFRADQATDGVNPFLRGADGDMRVARIGFKDGSLMEFRPSPEVRTGSGVTTGSGDRDFRLTVDSRSNNWTHYDIHGNVISRSDTFGSGAHQVTVISRGGPTGRMTWQSFDAAGNEIASGIRGTAFNGQMNKLYWDRESFQDFAAVRGGDGAIIPDQRGPLVREHRMLSDGTTLDAWRVTNADGTTVTWHWNKIDRHGNIQHFGDVGDRTRMWIDANGARHADWQNGFRWEDSFTRDGTVFKIQEMPKQPNNGSIRAWHHDGPPRVREYHAEPPAAGAVGGAAQDLRAWKEFDNGIEIRRKVELDDGTFLESDEWTKAWRRYTEIDGTQFVINERTMSGYVYSYDPFGRVSLSGRDVTPGTAGGSGALVPGGTAPAPAPGSALTPAPGTTGAPATAPAATTPTPTTSVPPAQLIGRDTNWTGLAAEYRGFSRMYREVNDWQWSRPQFGAGESQYASFTGKAVRSIAVDMAQEWIIDFLATITITGIISAATDTEFTWMDVAKAAFGATIAAGVKGTFSLGHFSQSRGGTWKVGNSQVDAGNPFTRRPNDDNWGSEYAGIEKITRWRSGTYDYGVAIGSGLIGGFISGAASAAIFGVKDSEGNLVKLTGTDALLEGAGAALGGLIGGVSIGAGRTALIHNMSGRWYHRQGALDIFGIPFLGKLGDKGFAFGFMGGWLREQFDRDWYTAAADAGENPGITENTDSTEETN
ncbi:hypothetical protein [Streptomyces sp. XC 2026]|uniref:hypothetical protein n=1 Tax=Streptomyces sp. XC 2026 TaxID=2782004 RepID=UPI001903C77C|nr:hypothetical protein [Streptomyces sp. XC 2026]QQN78579.1 hypothetical protein IPZ77_14850 [Streptomyces sp. XC 2026]